VTDWVRLRLDIDGFADAEFEPSLARAAGEGITFTTMADLGDTQEHRRALYELNRTCSADIPGRGEFYTYEEYLADRVSVFALDWRGTLIARDGGTWVGMTVTSLFPDRGFAFSQMTGVLAPYRGRGLSLALKLQAIRFARDNGFHTLATFHHPRNATAIAMNRRLGFVADPTP
jgi:GNAT superfamily N-acetyltransferase